MEGGQRELQLEIKAIEGRIEHRHSEVMGRIDRLGDTIVHLAESLSNDVMRIKQDNETGIRRIEARFDEASRDNKNTRTTVWITVLAAFLIAVGLIYASNSNIIGSIFLLELPRSWSAMVLWRAGRIHDHGGIPVTYVEQNCTFTHDGKPFTSGGAVVTPDYAIGYVGNAGTMTDWHGRVIGTCRVVSSRRISSWQSNRMYQIEATIDGVRYTGRGLGTNMLWRGKRMAKQNG